MAAETQTVMVAISFPALVVLGYLVAAVLIGIVRSRARPPLIGGGLILAGLTTVLLPLVFYGSEISRIGQPYPASLSDFLIVALFGLVAGILIQMGVGYLRPSVERVGSGQASR